MNRWWTIGSAKSHVKSSVNPETTAHAWRMEGAGRAAVGIERVARSYTMRAGRELHSTRRGYELTG
jgi:hypothetical protein